MAVNVNDRLRKLSPAQRRKVEARAAELTAGEMTLRELRKARQLTQVRMARALGLNQDSVSRLEKRSDFLLSTLGKPSRRWAEICRWWRNSPAARRWRCTASQKAIAPQADQAPRRVKRAGPDRPARYSTVTGTLTSRFLGGKQALLLQA